MVRVNIAGAAIAELPVLSSADFEAIQGAGGVQLSAELRSDIQSTCNELACRAAVQKT